MGETDHYELANGQIIDIDFDNGYWTVSCLNPDWSVHWYKEYDDEAEARKEFERWRK